MFCARNWLHQQTHCVFLLCFLLSFSKAIDFHAQVITRFLPKDLAVGYIKQVLISYFIAAKNQTFLVKKNSIYVNNLDMIRMTKDLLRNFKQSYSRRDIFVFWHPISKNVIRRRPTEISNSWDLDALLIQQTEWLKD